MILAIVATVPESLFYILEHQISFAVKQGYSVVLYSANKTYISLNDVRKKYGVKCYSVSFSRKAFSPIKDILSLTQLLYYFFFNKPDIIHANTPKAGFLSIISGALMGVKQRIYTIHGIVYCNDKGITKFIFSTIEKITCLLSHQVIAVSQSNREFLIEHGIVDQNKIITLNKGSSQGVDFKNRFNPALINLTQKNSYMDKYKLSDKNIIFGFVGRMVMDKGFDVLAKSWPLVKQKLPEAHLMIIGSHREPRDIVSRNEMKSLFDTGSVTFTGHIMDIVSHYSFLNILILPSKREGFPNVVLEAAAMKIPTITTDALGCIDSVIHGVTGYIYPKDDYLQLSNLMITLGLDRDNQKKMGKAAYERVIRDFDSHLIMEELFRLYEK